MGLVAKINDRIKVRKIDNFNNFTLNLRFDSLASSFGFNFLFNPDNADHVELACVSHIHEAIIEYNEKRILTGYIINQNFISKNTIEYAGFSGYSLAGTLQDCNIPPSLYPLQNDGLTIKEIADRLIKPFKLKYTIDPSAAAAMAEPIAKTTASETATIKDYLAELCTQKNIIITHDVNGNIIFTKPKVNNKPVYYFKEGDGLAYQYELTYNGQPLHSEITVIKQADKDGGNAGQYTIKNPYVPILFRPKVLTQSSGDDNSTQEAAKMALADELRAITLKIYINDWLINKDLILPNNIIQIENKNLYLFNKCKWFIESVEYTGDSEKITAVLNCVLPEVYSGQTPKNIFVDRHKNSPLF